MKTSRAESAVSEACCRRRESICSRYGSFQLGLTSFSKMCPAGAIEVRARYIARWSARTRLEPKISGIDGTCLDPVVWSVLLVLGGTIKGTSKQRDVAPKMRY